MATTIDTSTNPLAAYGYDQATGQQLAQSLGLTPQQLAAAFSTTQATTPGGQSYNPQGANYTKSPTGQGNVPSSNLEAVIQQLKLSQAVGGLGGGQQQGPPSSIPGQVSSDPMNAATNLGAAALNMPAIYNPTPGQIPAGSKGGIAQVASPVSSGTVPTAPTGPWSNVAGAMTSQQQAAGRQIYAQYGGNVNTASPSDISTFYQGITGQPLSSAATGPAPASGGTPTPTRPSNAATGAQPATPFATAPPAPGLTVGAVPPIQGGGPPPAPQGMADPAHMAALENAGKALFAHLGGDPSRATHQDIMDFHNQLVGTLGALPTAIAGGAVPGSNYTAGVNQPPNTVPPKQMAAGGIVPGQGNQDTVPALLTPGEYVIPKDQVAQAFGGRTPVQMAGGGFVSDDNQNQSPREARRRAITTPGQQPAPQTDMPSPTSAQGSSSSAPAAPGGGQSNLMQMAQWAQQARAAQAANANVGSGGPGSIDRLGTLGDESIITGQGGPGQPGGPGTGTMMAAGAISDLANGLTAAAQTYANSFKNWQMQKSAIPTSVPNYQTTTLQQDQTT
jgi:hypothetical protein